MLMLITEFGFLFLVCWSPLADNKAYPGGRLEILLMAKLGFNGKDDDEDGYIDEEDETEALFRSLSNLITARSNCFTIVSQGKVMRSEEVVAEKKLKVVVDRGTSPLKIKYYRELSD